MCNLLLVIYCRFLLNTLLGPFLRVILRTYRFVAGFASDLNAAQRILLQNFNTLTETVFFQEPRFFGGLRHSQKEESRLKMCHAAEGFHFKEPMKMSIEYGTLI
ncbi:hypothetical protein NQ318_014713 [Aromia moschata]|uniref:Uncharacterized protein n=1 Tax=Aromia moschata TaxID=1265417 RepID=A0AAV8ZBK5_9CUCU|nr:hypothetical protein NQ318_014713 [Aromia moschata]